jgi:hypothetical protein
MLYDLRGGTSICDLVVRKRMHSTTSHGVGISGISIKTTMRRRTVNEAYREWAMRNAGNQRFQH